MNNKEAHHAINVGKLENDIDKLMSFLFVMVITAYSSKRFEKSFESVAEHYK